MEDLCWLHLSHGIGSVAQSLGLNSDRTICAFRLVGRLAGAALFIGYASIPIACFLGLVQQPGLSL